MNIGFPVVFDAMVHGSKFTPLSPISTRGDDPDSFSEDFLQRLISEMPNVLPVREFLPSSSSLFSLGREIPVDIGGSEVYIDNLLVTNDGYLVIVETKLYRNSEAIRSVVTQTLQYGMAIGSMTTSALEGRIKRGIDSALCRDESIGAWVSRLEIDNQPQASLLPNDFEEAFENHLRRGEVLMLVVSDGIRAGVERVTDWLNDQGSSTPFSFGLVELKFFKFGDQRLIIPRTTLKTQVISRHVVVVDIQTTSADVTVVAGVKGNFQSSIGGNVQESRSIKTNSPVLTKVTLLALLRPEDRQAATRIIEQLETLPFDQHGLQSTLKFGFNIDGVFHTLVSFDQSGVWLGPYKKDAELIGADAVVEFRNEANQFAPFFAADKLTSQNHHYTGSPARYQLLEKSAAPFAAFVDRYRTKLIDLINEAE